MPVQKMIDRLPGFYRSFLPPFFKNLIIPVERVATCDDCAMWRNPETAHSEGIFFSRETKCCTYHPNMPNFLVGALLDSTEPDLDLGRRRIREAIQRRISVTPHGLLSPSKHTLLYNKALSAFGKSKRLRCPYYAPGEGVCTLWPYLNEECMTWFCKHNAGSEGDIFWKTAKKYLAAVREALVRYTLYTMNWDPARIIPKPSSPSLAVEELDDEPPSEKSYQGMWGEWAGREEDFYRETYRRVSDLIPEDFEKISGITQKILLKELTEAHRRMVVPKLPEKLKRNPTLRVEKVSEDAYALTGYSPFDPIVVSKKAYEMIDFFDGKKSNREVLRDIRAEGKYEPTDDLLLSLYQFRILLRKEDA
jgi:hypothetical protein